MLRESFATAYSQMSDRDLVIAIKKGEQNSRQVQAMTQTLYLRYMNFIHKHWHALSRQLNGSHLVQDAKDDFYSESYVSFTKALAAVDVNKIQNDKWKFLGYFGFYLSNQRNTFAKKIIKKYQEETPIEISESTGERTVYLTDISEKGTVSSAEDSFLQDDQRRRFWSGLNRCKTQLWGDAERTIFDMREKGASIKTICTTLEMSPWKYNKILERMKSQLEHAVEVG